MMRVLHIGFIFFVLEGCHSALSADALLESDAIIDGRGDALATADADGNIPCRMATWAIALPSTCQFDFPPAPPLPQPPQKLAQISAVEIDGQSYTFDPINGWSLLVTSTTASSLVFNGDLCAAIGTGGYQHLTATWCLEFLPP